MSDRLLLDTHIALWFESGHERLLIATAIDLGCPLVTYDDRIRRFGERHGRQYGFAVGA